jgi:glycosyltransferase involved in cell wall biosynthesis
MSDNALRVAMLCESFGELGGVAQIVEDLAAEFARASHRIAIVSNPETRQALARPQNPAVEQVWLQLPRSKPTSWRHPERFLRRADAEGLLAFLRQWRPDLLNIHGGLRNRFPAVIAACHAAGVPLVQSFHLVPTSRSEHSAMALRAADAVTFASTAIKQGFEELSSAVAQTSACLTEDDRQRPIRPWTTIRGGVDPEAASQARSNERPRPFIFSASRFDLAHKAVDALVAGFALIADEYPEIDLIIAGDGTGRRQVEEMITAGGLNSRIQLLGTLPRSELWGWYKGAIAFAMLSRMAEGLPLVFFEAMACGTAVIGTRTGGTPEIISHGETGLLVERNEPREVAAVLRLLLSDTAARARMARQGQKLVVNRYSWRTAATQFIELFHQCLSNRQRRTTRNG